MSIKAALQFAQMYGWALAVNFFWKKFTTFTPVAANASQGTIHATLRPIRVNCKSVLTCNISFKNNTALKVNVFIQTTSENHNVYYDETSSTVLIPGEVKTVAESTPIRLVEKTSFIKKKPNFDLEVKLIWPDEAIMVYLSCISREKILAL